MDKKIITFMADSVKVKSGFKVDNSGEIVFTCGEYQLKNIKDLVGIVGKELRITVEIV